MKNWLSNLKGIAEEVYRAVEPIESSRKASEALGMGAGGDITRGIDKTAEDIIIKMLEESCIPHILVSEECGVRAYGDDPEYYFVVDSIDGTTNALRGIPFYCTSIAVSRSDRLKDVVAGVVMNLSNRDLFIAEEGRGALLNQKTIRPSNVESLDDAVIGLDLCRIDRAGLKRLSNLILESRYIRHFGAVALEICNIAAGITDAFIDIRNRLRITDIAAGYMILREAGGEVLGVEGEPLDAEIKPTTRLSLIAAANKTLASRIFESYQVKI